MPEEPPIQRKRVIPPEVYIVCTEPGHLDAQIVHSRKFAEAIVTLSQQRGRLPKRIVDREEFESVCATIEAEYAVFETAKERQIESITFVHHSTDEKDR